MRAVASYLMMTKGEQNNTTGTQEERLGSVPARKLNKYSSVIIKAREQHGNKRIFMVVRKATGRPLKVNYKIIIQLADAIQHNATVTEACRYAGISRDTYYRHLNSQSVFAEKMTTAKCNQNKLVMSFLTIY